MPDVLSAIKIISHICQERIQDWPKRGLLIITENSKNRYTLEFNFPFWVSSDTFRFLVVFLIDIRKNEGIKKALFRIARNKAL
jgi:hypothetical protein